MYLIKLAHSCFLQNDSHSLPVKSKGAAPSMHMLHGFPHRISKEMQQEAQYLACAPRQPEVLSFGLKTVNCISAFHSPTRHHQGPSWIPCMLCSFSSPIYFQFLMTTYPMVPCCPQAVIPVLTPPPETQECDLSCDFELSNRMTNHTSVNQG